MHFFTIPLTIRYPIFLSLQIKSGYNGRSLEIVPKICSVDSCYWRCYGRQYSRSFTTLLSNSYCMPTKNMWTSPMLSPLSSTCWFEALMLCSIFVVLKPIIYNLEKSIWYLIISIRLVKLLYFLILYFFFFFFLPFIGHFCVWIHTYIDTFTI